MLINMSGVDDQWMGVDMNIEHLINFLKVSNLVAFNSHIHSMNYRRFSPLRGFTHLGIVLVISQLQVTSYVP